MALALLTVPSEDALASLPGLRRGMLAASNPLSAVFWSAAEAILDKIADAVNTFCGSMYVFVFITVGVVAWLFLGNIVGFDKTPWPLLLTILNLPQLSIMVSLQVSANRAQAASDRRALADHETLIALHEMAKQQLEILKGQDRVLAMLDNFASKDMPGTQHEIQDCVNQILVRVRQPPAAG